MYATTTAASVRQATYQAIQHLLKNSATGLLQPMMEVQVTVQPQHVGAVNRDLTGTRRGSITEMTTVDQHVQIDCIVALSELIGYASVLRGMTQGSGEFLMTLKGYEKVSTDQQMKIVQSIRGY
jgi:elongation factor G